MKDIILKVENLSKKFIKKDGDKRNARFSNIVQRVDLVSVEHESINVGHFVAFLG